MFITSGDGSKTMPWRNGMINIEKHSLKSMQEIFLDYNTFFISSSSKGLLMYIALADENV